MTIESSELINELAAAMAKAQAQMGAAAKDSDNPFFQSKYADLAAVISAVRKPFADNGLSFVQFPVFQENRVGVSTRIMHLSGQWLESEFVLPCKQDAHGYGAAITYARRFGLQSAAGVPAEDDDGNAAVGGTGQESAPLNQTTPNDDDKPWFNDDDLDKYKGKMVERIQGGEHPKDIAKSLRKTYKVSTIMAAKIGDLK